MKKLLTILVLSLYFITPSQADDISDFQIEGISIGDSLLKYVSEKQIKKKMFSDYPNSKRFSRVTFNKSLNLTEYEDIQFHFKTKDKKYIIESMSAGIYINNNFSKCIIEKKKIYNDIKNVFLNLEEKNNIGKHTYDEESKVNVTYLYFPNGGFFRLGCIDWSKKVENDNNWSDHLSVGLNSEEFSNWLNTEAYN